MYIYILYAAFCWFQKIVVFVIAGVRSDCEEEPSRKRLVESQKGPADNPLQSVVLTTVQ